MVVFRRVVATGGLRPFIRRATDRAVLGQGRTLHRPSAVTRSAPCGSLLILGAIRITETGLDGLEQAA